MNRRFFSLALALALIGVAAPAAGADLDDDLDRVRDRIGELRTEISEVARERSDLAREVLEAADALEQAELEATRASSELRMVDTALTLKEEELAGIQDRLIEQFATLSELRGDRDDAWREAEEWALRAYMGGSAQPSIAFNAAALSDISVGTAYLEVLTGYRSDAADRYGDLVAEEEARERDIRALEEQAADEVEELESLRMRLTALQADVLERQAAEELAYERQAELLDALDDEIAEFEGELAALEREESSIRAKIAAATTPTVTSTSSGLLRPVPGAVSSGFGMRVHPITGQTRMHNGIDMDGALGDPIRAARAGTVILAGVKGGYGTTVMIDHGGGMVTLYAHQSRLGVSSGDRVARGEVIGYVGSTGQSTGPHLHFEVRINGVPTDPLRYL